MALNIVSMISKYNHDKKTKRNIDYIVIHWVGSVSTAKNNGAYFQGGDRQASAHYFVDENFIVQSVLEKNVAWAVGSSGWLDQGSIYAKNGHKYWGKCTNENSISIEMCCHKQSGKLYISDATIERTGKLVRHLMKKYDIPASRVIRHFDVNGKLCPLPYIEELKWQNLRAELTGTDFRVVAKMDLNARATSSIASKKIKTIKKGTTCRVISTNAKKTRGILPSGCWISIKPKYVSFLKDK